ncbi:hypothetical protein EU546_07295, partial [Candidatus Thorarchaeota archaeon]
MKRGTRSTVVFLALLVVLQVIQIVDPTMQTGNEIHALAGHVPHAVISINGDDDFATQASSEGWPGAGTEGDPYRIENYYIDASTADGISFSNTRVQFVVSNCTIYDGLSQHKSGISLENVSNALLLKNDVTTCYRGIYLRRSDSNSVINNTCSKSSWGISLDIAKYSVVHNNTLADNTQTDIYLSQHCHESVITNNTCLSTGERNIGVYDSLNVSLSHNRMHGLGLDINWNNPRFGGITDFSDNTINGTPVLYLGDDSGGVYSGSYSQVILAECNNILVRNINVSRVHRGVTILHCNNTVVKNVSTSACMRGVYLRGGFNVTLSDCNISNSRYYGVYADWWWGAGEDLPSGYLIVNSTLGYTGRSAMYLGGAGGVTVFNSTIHHSSQDYPDYDQIYVRCAHDVTVASNTIWGTKSDAAAIYLQAINSMISNNVVFDGGRYGVYLSGADGSVVSNNNCSGHLYGVYVEDSNHTGVMHNQCSKNSDGVLLRGSSSYDRIEFNNCSECSGNGIRLLDLSAINTVANNTCSNNTGNGIVASGVEWAIIANNTCEGNDVGISLGADTYNNSVYWNVLSDNTQNGYHNGKDNTITNNYWSNYTGTDGNGDGIGDTPHPIPGTAGSEDPYPLMSPSFTPELTSWVTTPTDQFVEYGDEFSWDLDTTG